MSNKTLKTGYSGTKKGNGAYYGYKKYAKKESNKKRRVGMVISKKEISDG